MNAIEDFVIKLNWQVVAASTHDMQMGAWGKVSVETRTYIPKREPSYPGEGNRLARRTAKARRRGKVAP